MNISSLITEFSFYKWKTSSVIVPNNFPRKINFTNKDFPNLAFSFSVVNNKIMSAIKVKHNEITTLDISMKIEPFVLEAFKGENIIKERNNFESFYNNYYI
ncbi:MAG: hypothetical protein ABIP51_05200 [Bacteroidia bacterium]